MNMSGMIITFVLTIFVLTIIVLHTLIVSISKAFIFKKAGVNPDKAFMPFYKNFTIYTIATGESSISDISDGKVAFCIFFELVHIFVFLLICFVFMMYLNGDTYSRIEFSIFFVFIFPIFIFSPIGLFVTLFYLAMLTFYLSINQKFYNRSIIISFAEKFGKNSDFAMGLIYLPIIFYPILAFGKARYKS